jgi:hypothetical protein
MTRARLSSRDIRALRCLDGQVIGVLVGADTCRIVAARGLALPLNPKVMLLVPCWIVGGMVGLVVSGSFDRWPRWARVVGWLCVLGLVVFWFW